MSSRGFAYGYLGGGLLLLIHLIIIMQASGTAVEDLVTRLSIAYRRMVVWVVYLDPSDRTRAKHLRGARGTSIAKIDQSVFFRTNKINQEHG